MTSGGEIPPTVTLDMVCTCNTVGLAEAEALLKEVLGRLEITGMHTFLTTVVQSLNWDYGVSITGIYNDMWSGVRAERYRDKRRIWVDCDEVEYGIAAIWKAVADGALDG